MYFGLGSLGSGLMGLGGSGVLTGGGGSVSANPGILSSSGMGSGGLMLDSLGNNGGGMYSSGRSGSMDRGMGMGSRMDDRDRGDRMESRMSGGRNIYSSSVGGGSRMVYDRVPEYDRGRASSMEYDGGRDRGGSDPYGKFDTSTVFVKNVSWSQFFQGSHWS